MRSIAVVGTLCLLLISTALAQTPQQPKDNNSSANTPIQQQVKQNLSREGFTNIRVMPESFLVRANDKSGNPVMMIINPDSVTAVTALGTQKSGQSSATASGKSAKNSTTTSQ